MIATRFCAAALLAFAAVSASAQAPDLNRMDLVLQSVPDGPVAVVDGKPIRPEVFKDLYMGEVMRWAQMNGNQNVPDDERLGIAMNSLRVLIEREVLYQEAAKRKITVSDADLQEKWKSEIADLTKRVTKDGEPVPSEADVLKRANTTKDEALAELRRAMQVDQVREQIMKEKGVTVTDQEVADWFAKNKNMTRRPDMLHLKQIFFKADKAKKNATAKQKAEDAIKRLKAGESFEGVANKLSEGQYKDKGGEWPVMPADQFPPFIRDAAAKMKPGEVSEPIESQYGIHILKLVEVIPGQEGSIDNAGPRIKEMMLAQKGNRAVSEYCSKITGDPARVQVYLDLQKQLELRPDLVKKLSKEAPDMPQKPSAPKSEAKPAPEAKPKPAGRETRKNEKP